MASALATEALFACERPSRSMYWLAADGRLTPLRCGASNRCAYCAWLTAVENSLVVGIDARHDQPTVGLTLTTHRPDFDMARFRTAVAQVFRWLREQHGDVQYLGLMEWTTGLRSPGKRPHMHGLVKGLDPALCPPLERELSVLWERLTDGAWVVDLRELRTPGGAIAYMVGHHHKREQAPPPLFGGKRFRPSQGYFDRPVGELREQARGAMVAKRHERAALAQLVAVDPPDDVRDDVLEELLWQAQAAPAPTLMQRDVVSGELCEMPTSARASDREPRSRSWLAAGRPYA